MHVLMGSRAVYLDASQRLLYNVFHSLGIGESVRKCKLIEMGDSQLSHGFLRYNCTLGFTKTMAVLIFPCLCRNECLSVNKHGIFIQLL